MKLSDKQYLAKILYTSQKLDQKLVAQKVDVSEVTMSKWVNQFGWKNLRSRLLVGKEEILSNLYEQLEELNNTIREKDKGSRYADTKQADVLIKLTASIRNMETELAIADIVGSGLRFIKFIQQKGTFEQVSEFAELWNAFIQFELKK
jgi:transposase